MRESLVSLFHAQSYRDAWDDYERSLNKDDFACFDYVILTASNEQQAEGFMLQIEKRIKENYLPQKTKFAVIPDFGDKRIGSGGATLSVIKYISECEGTTDFSKLRILVIHSGGDSKRVPQYSALGKLFSPVPRLLPDGRPSTLFDEFIITMSGVPSRIKEGMLLLSGDVLLLFNPLLIDFSGNGAAALSFKEHISTGKNHGVYLKGADGNVTKCLQKQSEKVLREVGAVNEKDMVDIDTGAIIFSPQILSALYTLIDTDEKYCSLVNDTVRLSLYADFLYPMASDSTLDDFYKETPEGEFSDALTKARTLVWNALRPFRIKLMLLAPSKFIHFGTTAEIMSLLANQIEDYAQLGWSRQVNSSIADGKTAGYNSVLSSSASCGENCYLESSYVHNKAVVGNNVLLSFIEIKNATIPDNVVLHGLKQQDGKFVARIFGINDNPKKSLDCATLFSIPLNEFIKNNDLSVTDLWENEPYTLWNAKLYPECDTIADAVSEALNIYSMAHGNGDVKAWKSKERKSLCSGFNDADSKALVSWDNRMKELIAIDGLSKKIRAKVPASEIKGYFGANSLTKIQTEWIQKRLAKADYGEAMRLNYYIGQALSGAERERFITNSFDVLKKALIPEITSGNKEYKIKTDQLSVKLPLRVNFGGGWSDTPPYCNENGGTVLNAAILLNGEMPVEVILKRIDDKKIVFHSNDMNAHGEFTEITELQNVGDPSDSFVLQKAAMIAIGLIPQSGGDLEQILDRIGGGFIMQTEVTGVPKGSGLGTSSILAAACVKALLKFLSVEYNKDELYELVLNMEQLMSTGGGWQDQVGGLCRGIKYITTAPGISQKLTVKNIKISNKTKQELNERLCVIYTGQRRLARNLLREVVGKYIGNEKSTVDALHGIQCIAAMMRFELEKGNVDNFAKLLDEHWELSKVIDAGSSNVLIDYIFETIDEFCDGKMICGAGGGGFLQVILKKGVTKEQIQTRLESVFYDSEIEVWDCTLI